MDKLSEIWQNIKDRLSNPFISSFFLSWVLFKWREPIGLLMYNGEQIEREGYDSFFQFIERNVVGNEALIFPLIAAFVYTLTMPVLRQVIDLSSDVY
jgi:hypothetical protein